MPTPNEKLAESMAEDRARYLHALDRASIDLNIAPFAAFLAERVGWSVSAMTDRL